MGPQKGREWFMFLLESRVFGRRKDYKLKHLRI